MRVKLTHPPHAIEVPAPPMSERVKGWCLQICAMYWPTVGGGGFLVAWCIWYAARPRLLWVLSFWYSNPTMTRFILSFCLIFIYGFPFSWTSATCPCKLSTLRNSQSQLSQVLGMQPHEHQPHVPANYPHSETLSHNYRKSWGVQPHEHQPHVLANCPHC